MMNKYIGLFLGSSIISLYFCEAIKYSKSSDEKINRRNTLKRHSTMKAYGVDMSHIKI